MYNLLQTHQNKQIDGNLTQAAGLSDFRGAVCVDLDGDFQRWQRDRQERPDGAAET